MPPTRLHRVQKKWFFSRALEVGLGENSETRRISLPIVLCSHAEAELCGGGGNSRKTPVAVVRFD